MRLRSRAPGRPADDAGAKSEIDDQPLGAPADLDPDDAPLPGLPDTEPPSSGQLLASA